MLRGGGRVGGGGGGVGGGEGRVGWEGGEGGVGGGEGGVGVGREEEKPPQVKTRGDQLPTDGPDHTIRPKGHHSGQG